MSIGWMCASVLHGPHDLPLEDRPVPRPRDDDVRVRVSAVGVCGSDIHYFEQGGMGSAVVRVPMVLGHEASGVVVDVGRTITTRRVGQRVYLEPGVPCRTCDQCLSGHYSVCPAVRFFATPPVDGSFAECVTLPAAFAHTVPDCLSDDAAELIEPWSVEVWATRRAAISPGDRVLVTGAGAIGLLAARRSHRRPARRR